MSDILYTVEADGVAVISFDAAGKSMNVLTKENMLDFGIAVRSALQDEKVKGVVITSGKKDFMGGVDLSMLGDLCSPYSKKPKEQRAREGFDLIMSFHKLLREYETSGKIFVCAIPGTCMGGGFEIALACHYRIVADKEKAQIGLPESKVGLMPGFGGTQRLPRFVGIQASSEALLQGKSYAPRKAQALGFVNEVVQEDELLERAKQKVREADLKKDAVQPWDMPNYKIPGGAPYDRAAYPLFAAGIAMTKAATKGNYRAQEAILQAVYEGLLLPFDCAMVVEVRYFTSLMVGGQAYRMINTLFLNKQSVDKGARRPKEIEPSPVKKMTVAGAGMMGAEIAFISAQAGAGVILIDMTQERAEAGKEKIEDFCDEAIKKHKMTSEQKADILKRVTPSADFSLIKDSDLIIEAVFEDVKVKAEIFKKIEAHAKRNAVIATNTSTIPVNTLAENMKMKGNFIGVHFFSPVRKMPLVEIIKGKKTGDRAVAKAFDFVKALKKTPILVNDARFFYANRCIIPYIDEACRMVTEGVAPALIENAALSLGFPVGPLQLTDEISLDLAKKINDTTASALGADYVPGPGAELVEKMLKAGRSGKKAGKGFYDYPEKGEKTLSPDLTKMFPPKKEQPDPEAVRERLLVIQTLEAVKALEEKVITDIRDADVGAIFGWGYPAYTGGPLMYIDDVTAKSFFKTCETLTKRHGDRFKPSKLLRELGATGERIYNRFAFEG